MFPENAASDRPTLRGLTQFPRRPICASPQIAEYKPHPGKLGFESAFCDNQIRIRRKSLILKRRDAGAVDQARLEIDSAHAC